MIPQRGGALARTLISGAQRNSSPSAVSLRGNTSLLGLKRNYSTTDQDEMNHERPEEELMHDGVAVRTGLSVMKDSVWNQGRHLDHLAWGDMYDLGGVTRGSRFVDF